MLTFRMILIRGAFTLVQMLYRPDSNAELAACRPIHDTSASRAMTAPCERKKPMPLVDIQLIRGVFSPDQKKMLIEKVTDAVVSVEGEPMRPVTWVRVQEIESGEWAVGGKPLTAADVRAMAAR